MMKNILLYTAIAATATIFTATDSLAYYNECLKSEVGSNYKVRCYDSNGNMTSRKEYNGDPDKGASPYYVYIYTYASNGNQTLRKEYNGDPDNGVSPYKIYTYTYDSNGKRSAYKFYTFNSDGSGTIHNYTCDGIYSTSCDGQTLTSTETFTAEQYASILASISPKAKSNRTYYTLEEAMGHVNHTDNNKIIFTFK